MLYQVYSAINYVFAVWCACERSCVCARACMRACTRAHVYFFTYKGLYLYFVFNTNSNYKS